MNTNPYYYYYTKKDKKYLNKFNIFFSEPNISSLDMVFHIPHIEDAFKQINLYEEPTDSLQELYLKRATQIRNDYDYVTLFYSGGADSHCILETFMLNNLFIDEIIIFDLVDTSTKLQIEKEDPEKFLYLNAEGRGHEIEKSAIPLAKYFIDTFSPHTKLTYFPKMQNEHLNFWKNLDKKQFSKNVYSNVAELVLNRPLFRIRDINAFNSDWKKIKSNKKVVHLWGREKPAIRYDDKGFYFFFNDSLFHSTFDNETSLVRDDLPSTHEYFFIHPNACKLFLKQAHILANKLPKSFFYDDKKTILDTRYYQDKQSQLIYQFNIQIPYQGLKTTDLILDYRNNPDKYPSLLKIAERTGVKGIQAWPSMIKFFIENNTLDSVKNYDNFKSFIYNEFFYNTKHSSFNVFDRLTKLYITEKFYFKKC